MSEAPTISSKAEAGLSCRDIAWVTPLLCIKLFALIVVYLSGWRFLMYDEPCRYVMTLGWIDHPFFTPGDHVWLGGFFYLAGTWLYLVGESYAAAKALAVLFGLAAIVAAYWAGLLLYGSRPAAFLTGLVFSAGHVNTWGTMSFMPEIFVVSFTLWGVALLLYGLGTGRMWPILASMACIGFSGGFRYEQWVLIALVDVLLVVLMVRRRIRWPAFVASVVMANWYIWAWMISSWRKLGGPLEFLRVTQEVTVTVEGNPLVVMWQRLAEFEPAVFAVGLVANVFCLIFGDRRLRGYAAIVLSYGVLFAMTMKVGTALSTWRIVQGWRALLTLMVPFLVVWLSQRPQLAPRYRPAVLGLGMLLGAWHYASETARATRPIMWGFANDTMALAEALRLENFNRTFTKPLANAEPKYLLLTDDTGVDGINYWILAYMFDGRRILLDTTISGTPEAIISRTAPPDLAGFQRVYTLGEWQVFLPRVDSSSTTP